MSSYLRQSYFIFSSKCDFAIRVVSHAMEMSLLRQMHCDSIVLKSVDMQFSHCSHQIEVDSEDEKEVEYYPIASGHHLVVVR